jgi:predicted 2-oxoglutarate/Fe(II)-dependent dioxygenase YbiX
MVAVPSGYFGSESSNIHVVEGFLCGDDLNNLSEYATNISDFSTVKLDETWINRVHSFKDMSSPEYSLMMSYVIMAKEYIEDIFRCNFFHKEPTICIWREGDNQSPHADKELADGTPYTGGLQFYDISMLIYLNDDYEGGELYFPQHDIQIKPKAGTLAFFPGDKNYLHGVNPIKSGKRYTCPIFWTIKEFK